MFSRVVVNGILMLLLIVHVHADATDPNHAWDFRGCEEGQDVMDSGSAGNQNAIPSNVSKGSELG